MASNRDITDPSGDKGPVVFVREGAVYTDSRRLAESTGKRHDHILRDIRVLLESGDSPHLGDLFSAKNELEVITKRQIVYYEMTRDSFALLAMGFTGKQWIDWKLRYIRAFNAMEAELIRQSHQPVDLNDPKALRGLLLTYVDKVETLQAEVAVLEPDAMAARRLAASRGGITPTQAAPLLKVDRKVLIDRAIELKWLYRVHSALNVNKKALEVGFVVVEARVYKDANDVDHMKYQPLFTGKGLVEMAKTFYRDDQATLLPVMRGIEAFFGNGKKALEGPGS